MKAILEYDLITDQEELKHAINGSRYWARLMDLDELLRGKIKYGEETTIDLEKMRSLIREVINE